MFYSDAMEEMRIKLFTNNDDGAEPQQNLYSVVSEQTFKYAGELIASSIVMNGPAPNIFAPWVYHYFVGGENE